jgi:ribonuclease P protein component
LRRAEFQRVYTSGTKVVGRYIVVFTLAGSGGVCRLGITATRKIGGAVVRNRARRRIRELFRAHRELLEGWSGDVVVNVRAGCAGAAWGELAEDLERCLSRLHTRPRPHAS